MEVKFKANRKDNINLWNYNFTLGHTDMGLFAQLPMKTGRINLLFGNLFSNLSEIELIRLQR